MRLVNELLNDVPGTEYVNIERMGGLTNRTYDVLAKDGGRYVVRIPGEGTEELINRRNEKISTEPACRLGIDAKLLYFGDDGSKITEYIPNAITMSQETMREDLRIGQAAADFKELFSKNKC